MTYDVWRPVAGFTGYEVSRSGKVRSLPRRNFQGAMRRGRELKQDVSRAGYRMVRLARDGVKHAHAVHHLVLSAFQGARPEGCQTRHLNGIRSDNRSVNLKWGTAQANCADRVVHGTSVHGARNPTAKLTAIDVERVFDLRRAGRSQQAIGDWLGASQSHVSNILRGNHWTQIAAI